MWNDAIQNCCCVIEHQFVVKTGQWRRTTQQTIFNEIPFLFKRRRLLVEIRHTLDVRTRLFGLKSLLWDFNLFVCWNCSSIPPPFSMRVWVCKCVIESSPMWEIRFFTLSMTASKSERICCWYASIFAWQKRSGRETWWTDVNCLECLYAPEYDINCLQCKQKARRRVLKGWVW